MCVCVSVLGIDTLLLLLLLLLLFSSLDLYRRGSIVGAEDDDLDEGGGGEEEGEGENVSVENQMALAINALTEQMNAIAHAVDANAGDVSKPLVKIQLHGMLGSPSRRATEHGGLDHIERVENLHLQKMNPTYKERVEKKMQIRKKRSQERMDLRMSPGGAGRRSPSRSPALQKQLMRKKSEEHSIENLLNATAANTLNGDPDFQNGYWSAEKNAKKK